MNDIRCPKCKAVDIPNAKPTLEHEQDGSVTCSVCGTNFYPLRRRTDR